MSLSDKDKKELKQGLGNDRMAGKVSSEMDSRESEVSVLEGLVNSVGILHCALKTSAGGNAAEDFTLSGVVATDVVIVTLADDGTNNISVLSVVTATGKITVTFSGDPGNDAIINVLVLRP